MVVAHVGYRSLKVEKEALQDKIQQLQQASTTNKSLIQELQQNARDNRALVLELQDNAQNAQSMAQVKQPFPVRNN